MAFPDPVLAILPTYNFRRCFAASDLYVLVPLRTLKLEAWLDRNAAASLIPIRVYLKCRCTARHSPSLTELASALHNNPGFS